MKKYVIFIVSFAFFQMISQTALGYIQTKMYVSDQLELVNHGGHTVAFGQLLLIFLLCSRCFLQQERIFANMSVKK